MFIVDGKGDVGQNSILDIVKKLSYSRRAYIINLNNPQSSDKYNPFKNTSPTVIKDMLINMTTWREEHYKLNAERYIQRLIELMNKNSISLCLKNIINYLPVDNFVKLSMELSKGDKISKEEHLFNVEISKASGKIAESATARFASLYESELGTIFDESGIDIYTVLKEKAIILFILNPLLYPVICNRQTRST